MSKDDDSQWSPTTFIVFALAVFVLGLFLIVSQSGLQVVRADPIAWYKMDETSLGTNLLSNGDFETYTTSPGAPDNWVFDDGGTSAQLTKETSKVYTGLNSVKVTSNAAAFPGLHQDINTLITGHTYCIQSWAASDSTNTPISAMSIKLSDQTVPATIFDEAIAQVFPQVTYVPHNNIFTTAVTGHTYRVLLYQNNGNAQTGKIGYFDNIKFIDLTSSIIADSSGNNLNGNSCNFEVNKPALFDGKAVNLVLPKVNINKGSFGIVPHNNIFNFSTYSLSSWVVFNNFALTTNPRILDKTPSATGDSGFFLYSTTDNTFAASTTCDGPTAGTGTIDCSRLESCEMRDSQVNINPIVIRGKSKLNLGQKYFFDCTYDGVTLKLYQDNVLVNQKDYNRPLVKNSVPLIIGNRQNTGNGNYDRTCNCTLDDIRIYNQALTPDQVASLYSTGVAQYSVKVTPEFTQYGLALVPLIVGIGLTIYVLNMREE